MSSYSTKELKHLVEAYEEVQVLVGTQPSRLYYLVVLADLSRSLRLMPKLYREAVFLCGLMDMTYVRAGERLGVNPDTMHTRYRRGLEWLQHFLNGTEAY